MKVLVLLCRYGLDRQPVSGSVCIGSPEGDEPPPQSGSELELKRLQCRGVWRKQTEGADALLAPDRSRCARRLPARALLAGLERPIGRSDDTSAVGLPGLGIQTMKQFFQSSSS